MKKLLLSCVMTLCCLVANAQEQYYVSNAGQGQNGEYIVAVNVNVKKKLKTSAEDLAMRCAVEGVMFRGLQASDGYGAKKALIKDAGIKDTKAAFFEAFNNEGAYRRFATLVPGTLMSMKNKQTKMIETSATVSVDKEALLKYLEDSGVIKGFSNLW